MCSYSQNSIHQIQKFVTIAIMLILASEQSSHCGSYTLFIYAKAAS